MRKRTLLVRPSPAEASLPEQVKKVLRVAVAGDPSTLAELCRAQVQNSPEDIYTEQVRYLLSVGLWLQGKTERARHELEWLARKGHESDLALQAVRDLRYGDFDPLGPLREAKRSHSRALVKYIVTGKRGGGDSLLEAPLPPGPYEPSDGEFPSLLYPVGLAIRTARALFGEPLSRGKRIDETERFFRRHPDHSETPQLLRELAAVHRSEGEYEKALFALHRIGPEGAGEFARLREKAARARLKEAAFLPDLNARRRYLAAIVQHYQGTEAASEARDCLDALRQPEGKVERRQDNDVPKLLTANDGPSPPGFPLELRGFVGSGGFGIYPALKQKPLSHSDAALYH